MESRPLFRFIHCSDLHLDSPFEGIHAVEPWIADVLRKATFEAFQKVVDLAIRKKCDFVLIAGDVYNDTNRSLYAKLRFREMMKLLANEGIQCYLVHGNHDPLSGWEPEITFPNNVFRFSGDRVSYIPFKKGNQEFAHIYGISYQEKSITTNLAKLFQKTTNDIFSIGLLHCNVGGLPTHDNYAPCSIDDLVSTNIDYWALGHIHTPTIIRKDHPIILYPGNIQGLNRNESGERGCYLVQVEENWNVQYEFQPTDVVRWFQKEVDISNLNSIDDLLDTLIQYRDDIRAQADNRHVILRLILKGRGEMHQYLRRNIDLDKDLVTPLREEEIDQDPFVWVESIILQTKPHIDLEHRRLVNDFVGDFLRSVEEMRNKPNLYQAIKTILSQRSEWKIINQEIEPLLKDLSLDILHEAEYFGLDELLKDEE